MSPIDTIKKESKIDYLLHFSFKSPAKSMIWKFGGILAFTFLRQDIPVLGMYTLQITLRIRMNDIKSQLSD